MDDSAASDEFHTTRGPWPGRGRSTAGIAAGVALVLAVVPFVVLAFFAHPHKDDFLFADPVHRMGWADAQIYWYTEWTGRFVSSALISAFTTLDLVRWYALPALLTLAALPAAFWFLVRSLPGAGRRAALWIAWGMFLVYLVEMPALAEGLYWVTGSLTYQAANIGLLILLGALLRADGDSRWILAVAPAALVAAGSNETSMLMTLLVLGGGTAWVAVQRDRRLWPWLLALTIAGAVAALVVTAPGNAVRGANYTHSGGFVDALVASILHLAQLLQRWGLSVPLLAASVLLGALVRPGPERDPASASSGFPTLALLALLGWIGILLATLFPSFWAMGTRPPDRVLNVTYMVFLLGWSGGVAWLARQGIIQPVPRWLRSAGIAVFALAVFMEGNSGRALRELPRVRAFDRGMEARYDAIADARARGETRLVVPALDPLPRSMMFGDIGPDPTDIDNRYYARYFDLAAISTSEE